jgi:hypothetical protein
MSGRNRLPSGEPRKASQKRSRPAVVPVTIGPQIDWQRGAVVRWQGREGAFHRDVGDGEHAEVVIAGRTYRVRTKDLA